MGGLNTRKRMLPAGLAIGLLVLGLTACENDLLSYLFKNLFYDGWKVASWSTPAPVVDGETHLQGTSYRNGYPLNMVMGSNGKLHLVGWRVSAFDWVYSSRAPGAARFDQSFTVVRDLSDNAEGLGLMPGMDLISDDAPIIVYSHGASHALSFQQYIAPNWSGEEVLFNAASKITRTFVFFFAADFRPHVFFVTETPNRMYHTARTGSSAISPSPPEAFIDDVGPVCALKLGGSDAAFLYTDAARQTLYYRSFADPTVSSIWSAPDASLAIGEIAASLDSAGRIHACFGTYKASDFLNPAFYAIHYVYQTAGSWEVGQSIVGTSTAGPSTVFYPPSLDIAPDKNGVDRLHLAYALFQSPANTFIWYAYYDEAGWHPAAESLDTVNTNTGWTFPVIAVDSTGTVHVVYSWSVNELDRTMMYVQGTPREPQR